MKTPNSETKVGGIRLSIEDWRKLRAIMAARKGRAWLETFIRREYKRIAAQLGSRQTASE